MPSPVEMLDNIHQLVSNLPERLAGMLRDQAGGQLRDMPSAENRSPPIPESHPGGWRGWMDPIPIRDSPALAEPPRPPVSREMPTPPQVATPVSREMPTPPQVATPESRSMPLADRPLRESPALESRAQTASLEKPSGHEEEQIRLLTRIATTLDKLVQRNMMDRLTTGGSPREATSRGLDLRIADPVADEQFPPSSPSMNVSSLGGGDGAGGRQSRATKYTQMGRLADWHTNAPPVRNRGFSNIFLEEGEKEGEDEP